MSIAFADNVGSAAAGQHVDLTRAVWLKPPSASKDREEQTQHDADNDAGNDREIKRGMTALDANIAGQTAQPTRAVSAPECESEKNNHNAEDDQHFPEFVHFFSRSLWCVRNQELPARLHELRAGRDAQKFGAILNGCSISRLLRDAWRSEDRE